MDYSPYVYGGKKKEKKTYINLKFSGESKGVQNNKVLKTLRNQKKGIHVSRPILIWTYARFFIAGGIFWKL